MPPDYTGFHDVGMIALAWAAEAADVARYRQRFWRCFTFVLTLRPSQLTITLVL